MDGSIRKRRWRNSSVKTESGVTPLSFVRDLSSSASQPSSFGGRREVGDGFGVKVGAGVGGGGGGGWSLETLQDIQINQSPLSVYQVFGRGGGRIFGGGPRRRRADAFLGARWLVERLAVVGCVVIFISALFGGLEVMW